MAGILVWAHRGASGTFPENTLESFEGAVRAGADGIELDVQLSRDGELVVAHDERIDRMSDGAGFVKDFTLAELKRFNFNRPNPSVQHAELPTLREVYELIRPTGLTVNVELKTGCFTYPGIVEKTLELTAAQSMEDRVIYSSFNHYTLVEVKKLNPSAKTGMLYGDRIIGAEKYAKETVGVDALHPALYHLDDPEYMAKALKYGLSVHVWTADSEEDIRRMAELGVNAVITDYPERALAIVR